MDTCLNWINEKCIWKPEFIRIVSSKSESFVKTQGKPWILPEQTKVEVQTELLKTRKHNYRFY